MHELDHSGFCGLAKKTGHSSVAVENPCTNPVVELREQGDQPLARTAQVQTAAPDNLNIAVEDGGRADRKILKAC